jgi:hypothetical protein
MEITASDERSGPVCSLGVTEGMTRRERWLNLAEQVRERIVTRL